MATLRQIIAITPRVIPTKHPTAMTGIHTVAAIPVSNSFVLEARFRPLTELTAPFHQATLVWSGLAFELEKSDKCPVTVDLQPGSGKLTYMEKPSIGKSQVRMRCTCMAFYMYYSYSSKKSGSLAGQDMPKYVRKTPPPPEGLPYRNPRLLNGACKHLQELTKWAQQNKLIAP